MLSGECERYLLTYITKRLGKFKVLQVFARRSKIMFEEHLN